MDIDTFITFLGAVSLVFIFTIIILELSLKNPVTGRVWFESAWAGFFFILQLCASISLSAIGPGIMCIIPMMEIDSDSCTSTRVLLVFSWIWTLLLLGYLLLLTISAYMNQKENPQVWQCSVRQFFSNDTRIYRAGLVSPALPRFVKNSSPSIVAPQPRRPPQVIYSHKSGVVAPDYGTDQFRQQAQRPIPPVPAASPPQHQRQNTRDATATVFYPKHVQSNMQSYPTARMQLSGGSPPPLGDWPRADVITRPSRSKREPPRTLILSPSSAPSSVVSPNSKRTPNSATVPRISSRPNGPRTGRRGAPNGNKPPPLDLSKISTHSRPSTAGSRR